MFRCRLFNFSIFGVMCDFVDRVCRVSDAVVEERERYVAELSAALSADGFARPEEVARQCWENSRDSRPWSSQEEVLALFD